MIRYIFLLSFLITLSQETVEFLQEPYESRQSFGIYANAGLNFHLTSSWETLPGVAGCCDGYGAGSGLGYNFGLFYDVPLGSNFELDFRFNYSDLSGDITKEQESSNPVYDPANNRLVGSRSEFRIQSTVNAFTFEPGLNLKLTPQLRVRAGLFAGLLITKDVIEEEELITPDFGAYINENGERFRVVERYNGEIPEAPGTNFGLKFGASYDLPLNKNRTWFFVPEAKYAMSFVSLHANETWTTNQFTGGFALRYAPRKVAPPKKALPPPPPSPPPPLPPPPPTIDAVINAYAIDEFGDENEMAVMKVEEFLEANTHPLLTYIFFEENSSEIPPRYKKIKNDDTKNFAYSQYYGQTTIEVYYDILNIIGKRLQFYPQAELTLIGCNSNLKGEKENTTLSKNRAEAIKNYLIKVWDIEANRLIVEARNLPSSPSNSKLDDGIQENRRVEIIPNFDRVVEPVVTTNTTRKTNPPNLRFKPKAKTEIGAESWKVTAWQKGQTLKVFTGKGELPKQIDWNLTSEKEQRNLPKFDVPIEYQLEIIDNDGKVWTSQVQKLGVDVLTVKEKIFNKQDDVEIDKYSMIGFGYNSSKLSQLNLDMAETAKNRVYYDSEIDISGHSDRTGNAKDNKDLSEKRAFTTADYIEVDRKFAKGFGDTILLFDNDLPEGRFYSRTVKIRIINTIEGF